MAGAICDIRGGSLISGSQSPLPTSLHCRNGRRKTLKWEEAGVGGVGGAKSFRRGWRIRTAASQSTQPCWINRLGLILIWVWDLELGHVNLFTLPLRPCRSDIILTAHISAVFMLIICKGWVTRSSINPAAKRIKMHTQQRSETGPGGQDQHNSITLRSTKKFLFQTPQKQNTRQGSQEQFGDFKVAVFTCSDRLVPFLLLH